MNPDGWYKNPAFGLYQAMVPAPNQNFLSPTQQTVNNYSRRGTRPAAQHPGEPTRRLQPLGNHRFFIRANGNRFLESSLGDWTYGSPDPQFGGLHDVARARSAGR